MIDKDNPVSLTYLSKTDNKPITIPIWTLFYENKFFCFASRNSKKVLAIESGNSEVSLLIINKQLFPHLDSNNIPYLGINGNARLCFYSDNPNIPQIHQQLLWKYDPELSKGWIKDLYKKIESDLENNWLIEITPYNYFSY
ncbi:MAG: hypothetical protein ACW99A_21905 [Candidatus Kariarchaeaceae archaeon]